MAQVDSLMIGLLIGSVAAGIIVYLLMRGKTQLETATLTERLDGRERELELQQSELKNSKCEIDALQKQLQESLSNSSLLKGKLGQLDSLQRELQDERAGHASLERQLADEQVKVREVETRLEGERKQSQEKLQLLEEAKNTLNQQFQNIANRIFEEKAKVFADQSKSGLDSLLKPFQDQIKSFGSQVQDAYNKEGRERFALKEQIERLQTLNHKISEDAENLTKALKGEAKTQGTWGEVVLERVLEMSGLEKGREYETQGTFRNEDGRMLRPDVIVHLPEEKDVIIDSKVSLTAYERYFSSDNDARKAKALKEHLGSVGAHLKELEAKNYESLSGVRSLDFVLMFIPVEGAFMLAVENDSELFRKAFERNIIIVSPSTLLVTLRTIQNIWRYEYQNQNAQEIARQAGNLYDKFVGFVEDLDKVGDHINRSQKAYEEAHGKLTSGRGNLIRRSEELKKLGVQSKKSLDKGLVAQARDEILELVE